MSSETSKEAMLVDLNENATQGIWGQFSASYGPWREQAVSLWDTDRKKAIRHHDTSHHMSTIQEDGTPYRLAEFQHADDAAFAEALVNAFRSGKLVPATERDAALAENARLREVINTAANHVDGIRGAVESGQVVDKDVRGVAIMVRDNLRQALHPDNEGGE